MRCATIAAFDALVERERPLAVAYRGGPSSRPRRAAAAARKVRYSGPGWPRSGAWALAADGRAGTRARRRRRGCRGCGAAPAAPARARVAAFVHTRVLASRTAPTAAPSRTSAPCCARSERASPRATSATSASAPRTNFRARRWWDPLGVARRRRPSCRSSASRRRRRWRRRARSTAIATRAPEPVGQRRAARACRHPRLRLLAARARAARRHRAPAVPLVGALDGRSGGGARRPRARGRRHLRRGRRLGTRAGARMPAARRFRSRACSTASSTATG